MVEQYPITLEIENADELNFFVNYCQSVNEKSVERIKKCIEEGCDVNRLDVEQQKRPIDFAVESLCADNIEALLTEPTVNIDQKCPTRSRMTPIHFLIDQIDDANFERTFSCIRSLVKHLVNVNIPNNNGTTPISRIIWNRNLSDSHKREVLEFLFENAISVDIDNYENGIIRKLLVEKFPNLKLPVVRIRKSDNLLDFYCLLQNLLREPDEESFLEDINFILEWNEAKLPELFQTHDNRETLLTRAVDCGLKKAIERMLRLGADMNFKLLEYKKLSPIECACCSGFWEITGMFLQSSKINTKYPLLWIVLKNMKFSEKEGADYAKCFDILINSPKIDVDHIDIDGITALDIALTHQTKPERILALLNKGAYIGRYQHWTHLKKTFIKPSISYIDPNLLEQHFDNCITSVNEFAKKYSDSEIEFNYVNLVPVACKQKKDITNAYENEMEPINYISESKELRHLLMHPLIQSFLFLKWQRLALYFYINLAVYVLFTTSVLSYIFIDYLSVNDSRTFTSLWWWLSLITTFAMAVREVSQFILFIPIFYLKVMQNYLEILLLAMVTFVLCNFNIADSERRTLAAIIILLLTSEMILLLGSLDNFFIHFVMLESVLVSFIKAFALYVIILVAFALCFFAMLKDPNVELNSNEVGSNQKSSGDGEDVDLHKFSSFGLSLMKVILMSTGEFDAGSINFNLNPLSYVLFLLFLFFVSIVLLNLLNGLAVTDIQEIKSEAELNNLMRRVDLLRKYECILCDKHIFCHAFIIKWFDPYMLSIFKFLSQYKIKVRPYEQNQIYDSQTSIPSSSIPFISNQYRWTAWFHSRMPLHIMESVEQLLNRKKIKQNKENEMQQLFDQIANMKKALVDLSVDTANRFESLLSAVKSTQSTKV